MARSKVFLRTRDIDWAIKIGKNYIHAASAGGDLPKKVEDKLFEIWRELKNTEIVCRAEDVVINEKYIEEKFADLRDVDRDERDFRIRWYTLSFKEMAMRGFWSFDRDVRTPIEDSRYRLVARPGQVEVMPEYNFPEVKLQTTLEELDGKDIVRMINEVEE